MNKENLTEMPQLPPDAVLMQMLFGGLVQQSISAAAKFGIADLIGDKSKSVDELSAATGAHADALYRVLRLLAMVGIFAETEHRRFALTPVAELLRSDAPNSMRDVAIMQGEAWNWRNYGELRHSITTGETGQKKAHGAEIFEFLAANPADEEMFSRAMVNLSSSVTPAIVQACDFSAAKRVVDIAGGHGFLLTEVLRANPHLRGVLFDQPAVIDAAKQSNGTPEIADRVELTAGDFFESVPVNADVYLMKHIIHDWDDEKSVKILRNIGSSMDDDGKILIVEMVVPEGNVPSPAKMMDVQMLVATGGKERTAAEYKKLLESAGFNLAGIIPTRSPFSIIEAVKN